MAGIYIHIPFCKQRCTYCDFHFSTSFGVYREAVIKAISKELILRKNEISEKIHTIYFGGGTPSLLYKSELELIINTVKDNFILGQNVEITLEANPEDISVENLILWKEQGINRLSIGLQSFKESDLTWMNRSHNVVEGIKSVKLAQSYGFKNISVDIMYGLPNLSLKEWKEHLQSVLALNVSHISAYCLTIEPKTALFQEVKKKKILPASDEVQSTQFEEMIEFLAINGYEQYEISNFARDEQYSKHNSNYWKGVPFLGIGPSAHSFNGTHRRWNISNNTKYYKTIWEDQTWYSEELLSKEDQWNELFLTGLRTKWGVSKEKIVALGGFLKNEEKIIENYHLEELLVETKTAFCLSKKGLLFADAITENLFRLNESNSLLL
jgi:oxygen-independent coproporphyrinogen III oxidase